MTAHSFERAVGFRSLCVAARRAARGKRLSHRAARFLVDLEGEVLQLERELLARSYRPRPYVSFAISDPKPRVISAADFRDRVVHHALCAELEPTLESVAIEDSYACRPGKGMQAAVRRAQRFARGATHFLKLDIRKHFETVDHAVLKAQIRGLVDDEGLVWLTDRFIDAGAPGSAAGKGLPIGNLTSQHFANLYLGPIDHLILGDLSVSGYLRYMDDMVLFGSEAELRRAWGAVDAFVESRLGLRLRHEVCRLEPVVAGVPFLGFRIWPRLIRLDAARVRRFRRKMRRARAVAAAGDARAVATIDSLLGWVAVGDTRALCQSMERRAGDHHRADLGEGRWARTA